MQMTLDVDEVKMPITLEFDATDPLRSFDMLLQLFKQETNIFDLRNVEQHFYYRTKYAKDAGLPMRDELPSEKDSDIKYITLDVDLNNPLWAFYNLLQFLKSETLIFKKLGDIEDHIRYRLCYAKDGGGNGKGSILSRIMDKNWEDISDEFVPPGMIFVLVMHYVKETLKRNLAVPLENFSQLYDEVGTSMLAVMENIVQEKADELFSGETNEQLEEIKKRVKERIGKSAHACSEENIDDDDVAVIVKPKKNSDALEKWIKGEIRGKKNRKLVVGHLSSQGWTFTKSPKGKNQKPVMKYWLPNAYGKVYTSLLKACKVQRENDLKFLAS